MSSASEAEDRPVIDRLDPPAAIAGGSFELRGSHLTGPAESQPTVRFGKAAARLIVGGPNRVVVSVPEAAAEGAITVQRNSGRRSAAVHCALGPSIAENLHPVANPAIDAEGNIYNDAQRQPRREASVSVFKVDVNPNVRPFCFRDHQPHRFAGRSRRLPVDLRPPRRNDLLGRSQRAGGGLRGGHGVATGSAMDAAENVYVGDRTGTIFKIARDRQIFVFATLEPRSRPTTLPSDPTALRGRP